MKEYSWTAKDKELIEYANVAKEKELMTHLIHKLHILSHTHIEARYKHIEDRCKHIQDRYKHIEDLYSRGEQGPCYGHDAFDSHHSHAFLISSCTDIWHRL